MAWSFLSDHTQNERTRPKTCKRPISQLNLPCQLSKLVLLLFCYFIDRFHYFLCFGSFTGVSTTSLKPNPLGKGRTNCVTIRNDVTRTLSAGPLCWSKCPLSSRPALNVYHLYVLHRHDVDTTLYLQIYGNNVRSTFL